MGEQSDEWPPPEDRGRPYLIVKHRVTGEKRSFSLRDEAPNQEPPPMPSPDHGPEPAPRQPSRLVRFIRAPRAFFKWVCGLRGRELAVAIAVVFAAAWLWMNRFEYRQWRSSLIRINRYTGSTDEFNGEEWIPVNDRGIRSFFHWLWSCVPSMDAIDARATKWAPSSDFLAALLGLTFLALLIVLPILLLLWIIKRIGRADGPVAHENVPSPEAREARRRVRIPFPRFSASTWYLLLLVAYVVMAVVTMSSFSPTPSPVPGPQPTVTPIHFPVSEIDSLEAGLELVRRGLLSQEEFDAELVRRRAKGKVPSTFPLTPPPPYPR